MPRSPENERAWRKENSERLTLASKLYYEKNRKRILEQKRQYAAINSDRIAAYQRAYHARPDALKRSHDCRLRRKYGITVERYAELLHQQGNVCAICGNPESSTGFKLAVDHCHKTGSIRGILCNYCNSILGYVKDNPAILLRAASYLEAAKRPTQPNP